MFPDSPLLKDSGNVEPTLASLGGTSGGSSRHPTFVPVWNLNNESHLSVCTNAMEYARHAFLPSVVADVEAMGSFALSHNMSYAAAQTMFYLVSGARRI